MSGISQATYGSQVASLAILKFSLGVTATAAVAPIMCKLIMTAVPTASASGTELSGAGGYTTGGSSVTWNAASVVAGVGTVTNSAALTWTNSSASVAWPAVYGVELWDSAGTPVRWWFASFSSPVTVPAGTSSQLTIPATTGLVLSLQ